MCPRPPWGRGLPLLGIADVNKSSTRRAPIIGLCALPLIAGLALGAFATFYALQRGQAAETTLANVNGVTISSTAFFRRLEARTGRNAIAKLATDALALRFAESLGAVPSDAEIDRRVRLHENTPGWKDFAAKHLLTKADVRQICRLQLARDLAVAACNRGLTPAIDTGSIEGGPLLRTARRLPPGANYVERFADFRKSAKIEVFATQY